MGKARPFTWRLSMAKAVRGKRGSTTDSRINNARKFCQFRVPDINLAVRLARFLFACLRIRAIRRTTRRGTIGRAMILETVGPQFTPPCKPLTAPALGGRLTVARSN